VIRLTFQCTLADLTSLEQLLSSLMARGMIHDHVVQHLWRVYGTFCTSCINFPIGDIHLMVCLFSLSHFLASKADIPQEQRRGAIMILGMLACQDKSVLLDRVPLMIKIGLGSHGKVTFSFIFC
jgi:condensin complex subunit 1